MRHQTAGVQALCLRKLACHIRCNELLLARASTVNPTIIDDDAIDSEALILTQTGAILIYLAEKSGKLLSKQPLDRACIWEWLALDITDISSTRFNAFLLILRAGYSMKEGVEILQERAMMFYRLMDARLAETRYLAGDEISIADFRLTPGL